MGIPDMPTGIRDTDMAGTVVDIVPTTGTDITGAGDMFVTTTGMLSTTVVGLTGTGSWRLRRAATERRAVWTLDRSSLTISFRS